MSKFDYIVRPFQLPQVTYPTRVVDTTQAAAEDIVLTFGLEGSTKTFSCSFSESVEIYADQTTKEKSRTTQKKRIENPDDPDQHVDVELIKKLTTESGSGSKYQKTNYTFNNT
jgi:hypothetical protein